MEKHRPSDAPASEFTYVDISSIDNGRSAIVEPRVLPGAEAPSRARQILRAGDTVLSTVRTYLRNTAFVPDDLDGATGSTGFSVLRPNRDLVEPRYLFYRTLEATWVEKLSTRQTGSSYPAVRDADVRAMPIEVPLLDEQRRIVEAIETHLSHLDAGVESLNRAKRNLERIRWSAVAEEFDSDAPLMRIDRVCERPQYGWTTKSTDHAPSGLRLLRITDIQEGRVEWQSVPWCVEEPQDPGKYLLREGDVLVARSGATVGKSHLIKDPPPAVFASYLIRLRATSAVLSEYLACFLESPQYWQQISSAKAGIAQPNVNGRKLAALLLPVPGIPEQERTVLRLQRLGSIVANLDKSLSDALKRAQALRRAVLAEAFAGTLTTRSGSEFAA